ncbi:hypothetical protein BDV95DRAFT_480508 [Massariosphaeria phaeospora]|uniref:Prolyl 4-hydroxylase alpha subunit domain-containing protein n=1 Tax=Massariosphaeria phaeospora TaxID=100035 RepID=A0A7C8IQR1_9PLEO|nr:hypothetical protein BDV95DRAFT_480508 [Massariosphaeria phaeospora]
MAPSVSFGSLIQYTVLCLLAYILAGAPWLSSIVPGSADGNVAARGRADLNVTLSAEKAQSLVFPEEGLRCEEQGYRVHVFSREPLVLYVEDFLSGGEVEHVVRMSEPNFRPSTVWTQGHERLDPSVRLSEKAPLARDATVKCIEERARTFQGWRPHVFVEKLWAQRYHKDGHYTYHYDWSTATPTAGRVSSFMVYLDANCTGGGTHFPRLQRPRGGEWCRFVECEADGDGDGDGDLVREGTVFKPVRGNAVFWENIGPDGSGYEESWHAGLPVKTGTKMGLNIWSWYQEGYVPQVAKREDDNVKELSGEM